MKTIREINLDIKNEPGQLSAISEILNADGINILAFHVPASGKSGKLRFVTNDPDRALNVLKTAGFDTKVNETIACVVPRHPGGFNTILKSLKTAQININNPAQILPEPSTIIARVMVLAAWPVVSLILLAALPVGAANKKQSQH